jgi:integration host factor subunit beta
MHKSDLTHLLVEHLTKKHLHLTESAVKESVDALIQCIIDVLCHGDGMEIRGFGSFSVQSVPARQARNPKTGKFVKMSARHRLRFQAGKKLKLRINASYR